MSTKRIYYCWITNTNGVLYFFCSAGGGGGGTCLSSSGLFGVVPSPICSHGDSASKFLLTDKIRKDAYEGKSDMPKCLCELKGFVYDTLALLIIADFSVALQNQDITGLRSSRNEI